MDVEPWLRSLGLEQYEATFRENAIDETVLPHLTDGDLEKLGVLLGHRRKLLHAIANLQVVEKVTPAVAGAMEPAAPLPPEQDTQRNVREPPAAPIYEFRLTRLPYFLYTVLLIFVLVLIGAIDPGAKGICLIIGMAISCSLAVGRLHDSGSSGWWSLLLFAPFIGFIMWVYLFFAPGADPTEAAANVNPSAGAGTRVMHYRLGIGTIVATAGPWAEVKFDGAASVKRVPMKQLQIR